ncbi:MAG: hypothetical protein OXF75_01440 [Acidimicrobiaceae bacterium]|nr:hypothetical protein [Acidimicrobiaceae bacterium]
MVFGVWEHRDRSAAAHDLGEQARPVGLNRYSSGSKGRLIVAGGLEQVLRLAVRTVDIAGLKPAMSARVYNDC